MGHVSNLFMDDSVQRNRLIETFMSVIIKDMDMPKCCNDCFALNEDGDYPVCIITQEQRGYNFKKWEKRMDRCPLAEKDDNNKIKEKALPIRRIQVIPTPIFYTKEQEELFSECAKKACQLMRN